MTATKEELLAFAREVIDEFNKIYSIRSITVSDEVLLKNYDKFPKTVGKFGQDSPLFWIITGILFSDD